MQPALGVSSGCVRLRNASDSRAIARSAAGSPGVTRNDRRQQHLAGRLQAAAIVAERHRRRRHVGDRAVARREPHARSTSSPIEPAAEMRVAEDRAADGARRAGPRFEPGAAVIDRPAHEAVDRHRRVGAHVAGRRPLDTSPPRGRITSPRTPASATSTFDPPPSIVTGTPAPRAQSTARPRSRRCSASRSASRPARRRGTS